MPDLVHRQHPQPQPSPSRSLKTEHADTPLPMPSHSLSDLDSQSFTDIHDVQRPPTKRARKAINCEPCRASKLKCDRLTPHSSPPSPPPDPAPALRSALRTRLFNRLRARPCSSCVLRGTVSSCYQGSHEPTDDPRGQKTDPHTEIAHIRQSLATLESFLVRTGTGRTTTTPASTTAPTAAVSSPSVNDSQKPHRDRQNTNAAQNPPPSTESEESNTKWAPGMLGHEGGLYAGPTSMVTHLLSFKSDRDSRDAERKSSNGSEIHPSSEQIRPYDDDLLQLLPQLHIIDGLLDFYFEYCNWMYRHVHPQSFEQAWSKFKSGQSSDRLTLATACVIMALAIRYIPSRHALIASLPSQHDELCARYYAIARDALGRYRQECRLLSLELVEHLLVRTHYLTLSKNEAEEIWAIRGELVSIGTAMGLHRDPDKWKMPRDLAERRRWAWWHIILLERWQCFLFGRPLSVASHHFDTRMPSHIDPEIDPNGRLFLPNLHIFRLAFILGNIVDDAVSIRPVAYEKVQARDQELLEWMEDLPGELDLDEFRLARSLASPLPSATRLAVQSIILRTSYYHIRFTLHRPYAAAAHDAQRSSKRKNNNQPMSEHMAQSLETAVHAADQLINLVGQARPDLLVNASLAVPGHVHWGPFHCFSAAMFFAFQLIANPGQPGANLFRQNIRKVLEILNSSRGVAIADKALPMLTVLSPLFEAPQPGEPPEVRESKKKEVLSVVKGLAFPYHDSPTYPSSSTNYNSPGRRASMGSPLHSSSVSPPTGAHTVPPLPPGSAPPPPQGAPLHLPHIMATTGIDGGGDTNGNGSRPSPTHAPPYAQASPHVQQSVHGNTNGHGLAHPHQHPHSHVHPNGGNMATDAMGIGAPGAGPGSANPGSGSPTMAYSTSQPHIHEPHFGSSDGTTGTGPPAYVPQLSQPRPPPHQPYPIQAPEYGETAYVQGANDSMWGASIGFGQGEWVRFLDVMNRPDQAQMP